MGILIAGARVPGGHFSSETMQLAAINPALTIWEGAVAAVWPRTEGRSDCKPTELMRELPADEQRNKLVVVAMVAGALAGSGCLCPIQTPSARHISGARFDHGSALGHRQSFGTATYRAVPTRPCYPVPPGLSAAHMASVHAD